MSIVIDPKDDTGFIYYPSSAVCICSSPANEYQNSYYAFDKNRKGTILLGLENAIGFCCSSSRKALDGASKMTLVLTKEGCLISKEEVVTHEWLWDREAMNCGVVPSQSVKFQLNENLTFEFIDRQHISLEYNCDSIKHKFNLGAREKRLAPNYLLNATRKINGGYEPKIDHVTLKMRQAELYELFQAQRNKIHPKSENLSEMVRDIVVELKLHFDDISMKMKTTYGARSIWRDEAMNSTLNEIPRIELAGTESGIFSGYGESIYTSTNDFKLSQTLPKALMTEKGTWKNEQQVLTSLREMNPPLKRSATLRANSGRYSSSMVVNASLVSADNPTGMVVPLGIPLETVTWSKLKEQNSYEGNGEKGPLTVALVLRTGDPRGCIIERIAAVVNMELRNQENDKNDVRMIRIDVGENSDILKDIGIKELPTFLMYLSGKLVYAGPIGGRKVKTSSASSRPQILIIESDFKSQISMEKVLKKFGCDIFMCMTSSEAAERVNQVNNGFNETVFDLILISEDLNYQEDYGVLLKKLGPAVASKKTIICGLVNILGEFGRSNLNGVKWDSDYCTSEGNVLLTPQLSSIIHTAMQKPLKQASIVKALSLKSTPMNTTSFGLTTETLHTKIKNIQEGMGSKSFTVTRTHGPVGGSIGDPYIGIKLSAEDVVFKGRSLIK